MSQQKRTILLVEDNLGDARLFEWMVTEAAPGEFQIIHSSRLTDALHRITEAEIDLILLDLNLPDAVGLDTVRQMLNAAPQIPVVVLTGDSDQELAISAVSQGAQDYLVKEQVHSRMLVRALRYSVERKRSDDRLLALLEALQDGFMIISATRDHDNQIVDFRFEFVNEAGCRLNRWSQGDIIGRRVKELFPGQTDSELFNAMLQTVESGEAFTRQSLEYEHPFPGDERHKRIYDVRAVRLGDGLAIHWRDVSAQRQVEERLAALEAAYQALVEESGSQS